MSTDDSYNDPIVPRIEERAALTALREFLDSDHGHGVALVGSDGERAKLPPSALELLLRGVAVLSDARAISMQSLGLKIGPDQAARILQLPLSTVYDMLDRQEFASTTEGDIVWLRLEDVLSFLSDIRSKRQDALIEMTRLSQEMGHYEARRT